MLTPTGSRPHKQTLPRYKFNLFNLPSLSVLCRQGHNQAFQSPGKTLVLQPRKGRASPPHPQLSQGLARPSSPKQFPGRLSGGGVEGGKSDLQLPLHTRDHLVTHRRATPLQAFQPGPATSQPRDASYYQGEQLTNALDSPNYFLPAKRTCYKTCRGDKLF